MPAEAGTPRRQSLRFLALYAAAWAGSTIAYVPFLTLLLPLRVEAMTGVADVRLLAYFAFAGALVASITNIVFGWLSDRTHDRRHWIAAGLILNVALLLGFARAETPWAMLVLLLLWQASLNMIIAPLAALAGDYVPDRQKGLLGGLIAFAPAAGSLSSVVVTLPGLAAPDGRLVIVAAMIVFSIVPILVFGRAIPMPRLAATKAAETAPVAPKTGAIRMWFARLAVQISEATLFAFLLFYFRDVDPRFTDERIAQLYGAVTVSAVPIALVVGQWADARNRPILPLALSAALVAASLSLMAIGSSIALVLTGYVVFGLSTKVFLSLHTGQTLRVLPSPARRGRDLGVFNLTNTIPSLIMPWLTLMLVVRSGYATLFGLLALLAAAAAIALATIGLPQRKRREPAQA